MSLTFSEFFAFIVVTLFIASGFIFVFMLRIADWLNAREDRKKAEAKTAEPARAIKPA